MKFLSALIVTSAVAGSAGLASAGGYSAPLVVTPVAAPLVESAVPTPDWTGFYLGGQLGKVDGSVSYPAGDVDTTATSYGLHAGYLHDFGRFVGGGELAWDKLSGLEVDGIAGDTDGSMLRAKLLAGYDAGQIMPYATVGYANLKIDGQNGRADSDGNGYFYGVGAKFAVTDKVMLGAEVLRNSFSDFDDVNGRDIDATTIGVNVAFKF